MKGYWKNQEATGIMKRDGWLYTGDIAYYDDHERFFIVGRIKELIKVKGFQVIPYHFIRFQFLSKNSTRILLHLPWLIDQVIPRAIHTLYQVAPTELENLLRTHEDVEDAAVIGVPHERLVEEIHDLLHVLP